MRHSVCERGVSLIDTVVGTALLLLVFMGVAGAFTLTVDVVTNNKARAGAIALANERMEYLRSLTYAQVGTLGGIPAGSVAQTETIALNGVSYTRRTYIEYADDPVDGSGVADTNSIIADYKAAKVQLSWTGRSGTRTISVVSRFTPSGGLETAVSGGTLTMTAITASGVPVSNAEVTIVNSTTVPTINVLTYTNASGTASFIGTPVAANYEITVTKPGYSTSRTYTATAQNTSPNPGHLSVSNNQTTSATFIIETLGSKSIETYAQVTSGTWSDTFSDTSSMGTSTNIEVSGNRARFAGSQPWTLPADLRSAIIAPSGITAWGTFAWDDTQPAETTITYRVYYRTSTGSGASLVPDAVLPGNSTGFTGTSVDLSAVPVSTYPALILDAYLVALNPSAPSPSVEDWSLSYMSAQPVATTFSLRGAKTIGSGPSGTLYKYDSSHTTSASGLFSIASIESDVYTLLVNGTSTGYDISSACGPQPELLSPGGSMVTRLYLTAHTVNSFLVDVRASSTGALIGNAAVGLSRSGFAATSTTDACGQVFFSNLTSGSTYALTVVAPGYPTFTATNISIGGATRSSVEVN